MAGYLTAAMGDDDNNNNTIVLFQDVPFLRL